MEQPTVWVVGDWQNGDFCKALEWLRSRARCNCFEESCGGAISKLHQGDCAEPALILFVQSRPGQFTQQDIEGLHAAAPLARLADLAGPWCEGPQRGAYALRGLIQIPWHAWQSRFENLLNWQIGFTPTPRTATAAEWLDSATAPPAKDKCHAATAVIVTNRRAMYESFADLVQQLGLSTSWQLEHSVSDDCDFIFFDGWEHFSPQHFSPQFFKPCHEENTAARAFPRQLVLLRFPRPEDFSRAAETGLGVLAIPLLLADLAMAVTPESPGNACRERPALTATGRRN